MKQILAGLILLLALTINAGGQKTPTPQETRLDVILVKSLPIWWTKFPIEEKQGVLIERIASFHHALEQEPQQWIEEIFGLNDFPFLGLGISFRAIAKPELSGGSADVLVNQIQSVWKESPAQRAGLMPGDWLLGINGATTCSVTFFSQDTEEEVKTKVKAADTCEKLVKKIINSKDTVILIVERNGALKFFTINKASIGNAIPSFIFENQARWKAQFVSQKEPMENLRLSFSAAGKDPLELDLCFLESEDIFQVFDGMLTEVKNFLDSLQNSLPPEKR